MEEAGVVTKATDRGKSYGSRGEAQRQAEVGLGLGPSRPAHRVDREYQVRRHGA